MTTDNKIDTVTKTEKHTGLETEIKTLESEERQTIVHCSCGDDYAFRIWPSTYLI